jgi:DNA-binding transcriptional MerR regulator
VTLEKSATTTPGSRAAAFTRRDIARYLDRAFELVGSMDSSELLGMLEAHRPPAELLTFVAERLPEQERIRDFRQLWDHLEDLPIGAPPSDQQPGRLLQIGEVAELTGLSLRTVRHYDDAAVAPASGRSEGGFRLYADADIERLELVKRMKALGLALDEMATLADALERAIDPSWLNTTELEQLRASLQEIASRGEERIAWLERESTHARDLQLTVRERMGRCS